MSNVPFTTEPTSLERLFGVPTLLGLTEARQLANDLGHLLDIQLYSARTEMSFRRQGEGRTDVLELEKLADISDSFTADLADDLNRLRHWFDPVAKGERVRNALVQVPRSSTDLAYFNELIVLTVPDGPTELSTVPGARLLLTPEGCTLLHCLRATLAATVDGSGVPRGSDLVRVNQHYVELGLATLADTYRRWSRTRVNQTIALLTSEPSTLRPAAAGLLVVLLVNRNTAPDRALPRPRDRRVLDLVSGAIGAPALAYARTLTGNDRATASGVDLYRGWALGELTRRLGPALHTGLDEGIYLDASAEETALMRLAEDIERRPPSSRLRVPQAVDAALATYADVRPTLAGMALAHDRPSNTRRIRDALVDASQTIGGAT